jgi:hypothetical protein
VVAGIWVALFAASGVYLVVSQDKFRLLPMLLLVVYALPMYLVFLLLWVVLTWRERSRFAAVLAQMLPWIALVSPLLSLAPGWQ